MRKFALVLNVLAFVGCGDSTGPDATVSVAISPGTAVLLANDMEQFTATVLDQNGQAISAAVQWTSSASSVATVSGTGLVTALTPGTATIQASSGSAQDQVTVTVRPPFSIQLKSNFDGADIDPQTGAYDCRFQLTAMATGGRPGTKVEWTTSTFEWLGLDGTTRLLPVNVASLFWGSSTITTDSDQSRAQWFSYSKPFDLNFVLAYTTDGFDRFEKSLSVDCF